MSTQCRTCLLTSESGMKLDEKISLHNSEVKLCDVVMQCASVQITTTDLLPKSICESCIYKVSISYVFKKKCEESQKILIDNLVKTEEIDDATSNVFGTKKESNIDDSDNSDNDETSPAKDKDIKNDDNKNDSNIDSDEDKDYDEYDNEDNDDDEDDDKDDKDFQNDDSAESDWKSEDEKPLSRTKIKGKKPHGCKYCSFEYAHKKNLTNHLKRAHSKEEGIDSSTSTEPINNKKLPSSVKCKYCSKYYQYKDSLKRHVRTEHSQENFEEYDYLFGERRAWDRNFKCTYCPNVYGYQERLTRHILEAHSDGDVQNELYIFPRKNSKEKRLKRKCMYCTNVYCYKTSLIRHLRTVHGDKNIETDSSMFPRQSAKDQKERYVRKCTYCPSVFRSNTSLLRHVNKLHSKERKKQNLQAKLEAEASGEYFGTPNDKYSTSCLECCDSFESFDLLGEHQKVHDTYVCRICGREFNLATSLNEHLLGHSNFDYVTYLAIEKSFYSEDDVQNEEIKPKSNEDDPDNISYECDKCDLTFPTTGQVNIHKICHPPYVCQHCGIIFNHSTTLEKHLRKYHGKGKFIYKPCIECDEVFEDAEKLAEHYNTHEEFKCRKCAMVFKSLSILSDHVLDYCIAQPDLDKLYRCTICCNERFSSKHAYIKHSRKQTDQTCEYCGLKLSHNSMRKHMAYHESGDVGFACLVCNGKLTSPKELESHLETHEVFTCGDCNEVSESLEALRSHRFGKGCSKGTTCRECGLSFANHGELVLHNKKHNEDEKIQLEKEYASLKLESVLNKTIVNKDTASSSKSAGGEENKCELCGKVFSLPEYLKRHIKTHLNPAKLTTKCAYCDLEFPSNALLAMHMHGDHSNYKTWQCDKCDSSFFTRETLVTHQTRSHSNHKHICDICGRSYKNSTNLKIHMRNHTGEKPYKCDICEKSFTQHSSLAYHKRYHTDKRDHVCHLCGKGFRIRGTMLVHIRRHSSERNFECKVCGKRFKENGRLKKHMHIHTGEKNFVCSVCGKAFNASGILKMHMKIHTGEKPHGCTICGKRFIQAHVLRSHMNTHRDLLKY